MRSYCLFDLEAQEFLDSVVIEHRPLVGEFIIVYTNYYTRDTVVTYEVKAISHNYHKIGIPNKYTYCEPLVLFVIKVGEETVSVSSALKVPW